MLRRKPSEDALRAAFYRRMLEAISMDVAIGGDKQSEFLRGRDIATWALRRTEFPPLEDEDD